MPDWAFHYAGYAVAIIAALGVLIALFRDRAKGRTRCRKCWYDLSGAGDLPILCPECGKAHTKSRHLKRTRRHKRLAIVCLLVMVVGGYGLWVVPRVQALGVYGIIPTFALIIVGPWMDDDPWSASWSHGIVLDDSFSEHWFADQLDMRSREMSKPVATTAHLWFRWCENRGYGSTTQYRGMRTQPGIGPMGPQLRQRFIENDQLARWLLDDEVIQQSETFVMDVELAGSRVKSYMRSDEEYRWQYTPRVDVSVFYLHSLPSTWKLEWQERRDGKLQAHRFTSRGSASSKSSYTPWDGDRVTYQIILRDADLKTVAKWEVDYTVQRGDHLDRKC